VRAPRDPAAEIHCVTELGGRGGPPSEEGHRFAPATSQLQPGGAPTGTTVLWISPRCAGRRRATLEPSSSYEQGKGWCAEVEKVFSCLPIRVAVPCSTGADVNEE
jgi:hypothetical protein